VCVLEVTDRGMVQEFVPGVVGPPLWQRVLDRRAGGECTSAAITQRCREQTICKA